MKLVKLAILSLLISGNVMAESPNIKIDGTVTKAAKIPVPAYNGSRAIKSKETSSNEVKQVKFLKVQLSSKAKQNLTKRANNILSYNQKASLFKDGTDNSIQLGMNKVPVLNQGQHGTCVTFAATAAIDAALDKGDYISQLCLLELGSYLEKNSYGYSGWNGTFGKSVLNQIELFGVISKEQQMAQGCAGIKEYPLTEEMPETQLNVEDYHQISTNLNELVTWSPILDINQAYLDRTDTDKTIIDVKNSLKNQDRVTFAILLLDLDLGFMGAVGSHNATFDSWVLTPEIARDVFLNPNFGGHEMIITGYDDNATATDETGRIHRGLFTLRNSWGSNVGDHGNFYMSYDYFKVLVMEAHRIRKLDYVELE